uniref:ATP synthase complex subunit 8 n=1 Tax=Promethichthys prometheus TaxID=349644 RepID=T2HUH5_9SCOM|nr:ATP synthase F0 subunit 8 [Promethichthys prometheus]BAN83494.1 ATPase subunit 8 [Promethichthys prometheus]
MPQLDPSPWFQYMACAWLMLLTLIPMKMLGFKFPENFSPLLAEKPEGAPWDWLWQ